VRIDAQTFLRLAENTSRICTFDIEATGLRGDYNSVLCVSIKPYGQKPTTFKVSRAGNDKLVVKLASAALAEFDCWVGYYSKGFDIPMLNTRLLRHGEPPIPKRHHIDMYYSLKCNLLLARRSQAHYLDWLDTPTKKMSVSAEEWNRVLANPKKAMPIMVQRCESDVTGLENLYDKTKHLIRDITL
jgi:uncharacterized protein YprB with RNaseH-like and TPR domain